MEVLKTIQNNLEKYDEKSLPIVVKYMNVMIKEIELEKDHLNINNIKLILNNACLNGITYDRKIRIEKTIELLVSLIEQDVSIQNVINEWKELCFYNIILI
jgi:hypothetical protein